MASHSECLHLVLRRSHVQDLHADGSALGDGCVDAALTKDLLEALEALNRGATLEVECLAEVPVVEEEVGVLLAHVERRAAPALVCPEFLTLCSCVLFLAVGRQEDLLTTVRGPVHLDQHSHEAVSFGEVDAPLLVIVRYFVGEVLDIGKVDIEEVLCIDVALTSDYALEFLPLLVLLDAGLFILEQGVAEDAELELARAVQERL